MAKKKTKKVRKKRIIDRWKNENKNIIVKSREELWFSYWLDECEANGLIKSWQYESPTFKLSDPVSYMNKNLDQSKSITCDYSIVWNEKYKNILYYNCSNIDFKGLFIVHDINCQIDSNVSYVDVKPVNEQRNSSSVSFPYKRSWLLQTQGIWVQKVKPFGVSGRLGKGDIGNLFHITFTPTILLKNKEKELLTNKGVFYSFIKWKITKFEDFKNSLNGL